MGRTRDEVISIYTTSILFFHNTVFVSSFTGENLTEIYGGGKR
jgi:hypothetical protein